MTVRSQGHNEDNFLRDLPQKFELKQRWGDEHQKLVRDLRQRLRRFDFGDATRSLIKPLIYWLQSCNYDVTLRDRLQLQAISLASEYFDWEGNQRETVLCLRPTVSRLLNGEAKWKSTANDEVRRLYRQQIWCLLAWAYNRYEESEPDEAAVAIHTIEDALQKYVLDQQEFPCYGTQYHLWHLIGLFRRDKGDLEQASAAFARSLRFAQLRRDEKVSKYERLGDLERVSREREYFKISEARTLSLGLGEVEFFRGAFYRADALFSASESIAEDKGFPRWREVGKLYRLGCEISTIDLNEANSVVTLRALEERLSYVQSGLRRENAHSDYFNLATAFQLLALVRIGQAETLLRVKNAFPIMINGTERLHRLLLEFAPGQIALASRANDQRAKQAGDPLRVGPVIRLIQRICVEAYVRTGHKLAQRAVGDLIQRHHEFVLFTTELTLLRAELLFATGQSTAAIETLASIRRSQTSMGRRHDLWRRILLVRMTGKRDDDLRRMETRDLIDDGYLRALYSSTEWTPAGEDRLPFQMEGELHSFDISKNVNQLHCAIVKAALAATSDQSVEELFKKCGRKEGWFRALFNRYRHETWAIVGRERIGHNSNTRNPR